MITILNSAAALMMARDRKVPEPPVQAEPEQVQPNTGGFVGRRINLIGMDQWDMIEKCKLIGKAVMACRSWDRDLAVLQHTDSTRNYPVKSLCTYHGDVDQALLDEWFKNTDEDFFLRRLDNKREGGLNVLVFAGKAVMQTISPVDDADRACGQYRTRAIVFHGYAKRVLIGPVDMPDRDMLMLHPDLANRLMADLEKYPQVYSGTVDEDTFDEWTAETRPWKNRFPSHYCDQCQEEGVQP